LRSPRAAQASLGGGKGKMPGDASVPQGGHVAEGPFPVDWTDKQVRIETAGGENFVGQVRESNESGCIVAREVPEGDNPEPVARLFFYPWTSIRSIKLLEEPEDWRPLIG
jgi:hypothetical protein